MKFNVSNAASKVNSAVGIAAGITIGIAITLSAAVHIKRCIKDLLPAKKANDTVEIHVIRCSDKKDDGEHSDTKPEDATTTAKDALNKEFGFKPEHADEN